MGKFNFRLQRVLEVKEKVEDEKKNSYAERRRQLEEEHLKLENLLQDMEELKQVKNSVCRKTVSIGELSRYSQYIQGLNGVIDKQNLRVEEVEDHVESARNDLLEATKERRILENLKLKNLEEYRYELKQEEDKMTDQFVSYSSTKKTGED